MYDRPESIRNYKNIVIIVCGGSVINLEKILEWKSKYQIE